METQLAQVGIEIPWADLRAGALVLAACLAIPNAIVIAAWHIAPRKFGPTPRAFIGLWIRAAACLGMLAFPAWHRVSSPVILIGIIGIGTALYETAHRLAIRSNQHTTNSQ